MYWSAGNGAAQKIITAKLSFLSKTQDYGYYGFSINSLPQHQAM